MAQLYYEPRYGPLDILNLGIQLYGLKKQTELAKGRQDILKQKAALEQQRLEAEHGKDIVVSPGSPYAKTDQFAMNLPGDQIGVPGHIPGTKERTAATGERLAAIKEAEERRKSQEYIPRWEANMAGKPQSDKLLMLATEVPAFAPSINIILDKIEKGQLTSRWDVYRELKANEAVHIHNTRQRLAKEIEDATKKGEIDKVHQLGEIFNSVGPGMLEQFFGFPKEYMPAAPKMDIAASLAAGTSVEERMLKGQELISIRQEKRQLQQQVGELERMQSLGILEDQVTLANVKNQLRMLKEQEQEILGKKPKQTISPKAGKDYSHLWK